MYCPNALDYTVMKDMWRANWLITIENIGQVVSNTSSIYCKMCERRRVQCILSMSIVAMLQVDSANRSCRNIDVDD